MRALPVVVSSLVLCLSAVAAAAPKQAKLEELDQLPVPAGTTKRIALPAPTQFQGVRKSMLQQAATQVQRAFEKQGYEVVPPEQVEGALASHGVRKTTCSKGSCFARLGKAAGAPYVANIVISKAGKQFMVKVSVFDSRTGKLAANAVSMVSKLRNASVVEALRKQTPRAGAALARYMASRSAPPPTSDPAVAAQAEPTSVTEAQLAASLDEAAQAAVADEPAPESAAGSTEAGQPQPAAAGAAPAGDAVASAGGGSVSATANVKPSKLPLWLMGGGAAFAGAGAVSFGLLAKGAAADFKTGQDAVADRRSARTYSLMADVAIGAGVAAFATGLGMWLFTGSDEDAAVSVAPTGSGLSIAGTF